MVNFLFLPFPSIKTWNYFTLMSAVSPLFWWGFTCAPIRMSNSTVHLWPWISEKKRVSWQHLVAHWSLPFTLVMTALCVIMWEDYMDFVKCGAEVKFFCCLLFDALGPKNIWDITFTFANDPLSHIEENWASLPADKHTLMQSFRSSGVHSYLHHLAPVIRVHHRNLDRCKI